MNIAKQRAKKKNNRQNTDIKNVIAFVRRLFRTYKSFLSLVRSPFNVFEFELKTKSYKCNDSSQNLDVKRKKARKLKCRYIQSIVKLWHLEQCSNNNNKCNCNQPTSGLSICILLLVFASIFEHRNRK